MSKKDDTPPFKVETRGTGDLAASFPHTPEDFAASTQDYLAEMLTKYAWELVAISNTPHGDRYVFRAKS